MTRTLTIICAIGFAAALTNLFLLRDRLDVMQSHINLLYMELQRLDYAQQDVQPRADKPVRRTEWFL